MLDRRFVFQPVSALLENMFLHPARARQTLSAHRVPQTCFQMRPIRVSALIGQCVRQVLGLANMRSQQQIDSAPTAQRVNTRDLACNRLVLIVKPANILPKQAKHFARRLETGSTKTKLDKPTQNRVHNALQAKNSTIVVAPLAVVAQVTIGR